jgi:hypothetical protein
MSFDFFVLFMKITGGWYMRTVIICCHGDFQNIYRIYF